MDIELLLDKRYLSKHDFCCDLIDFLVDASHSELGYIYYFDQVTQVLEPNVWSKRVIEHCPTIYEHAKVLGEVGHWGDCIREQKPVIHNDYQRLKCEKGPLPQGAPKLYRHFNLPVKMGNVVRAVVGFGNADSNYSERQVEVLYDMVSTLWPAVQAKIDTIESAYNDQIFTFSSNSPHDILLNMLGAISRALEMRDEYTSSHQRNVAHICEQIALQLKLTENMRVGLVVGALVHDIGKLVIPSQILNKIGKLLPAEYELLKCHAEMGASIFKDVNFPWPIIQMVEQHHERFDGSGYPHGLKGADILLEARIIAVADTFDAMASDRPYRKSLGKVEALNVIKAGRNRLYDPYVVDAFLQCVSKDMSFEGRYR
ncbi:HD domain-containing phosphohydrolase [Thaumasiovibrio subtropicus]|uniref:HD domain-containing phosphohydrolase n=1 Tax=Thaumasiovibrio subtropicus TaxID=1891207 RepID=UPI000B3601F6|nr:HD domain-containing phosphohydrolase [Thaumasiovibrio subtropicus]